MLPGAAGASVDRASALHAYARGRLADGDGAAALALKNYRQALAADPDQLEIARRSYVHALVSGDMALAMRSATLLDREGALPRDGTLLLLSDAFNRRDWQAAHGFADRIATEGNFAFLVPILRSWIALGEGKVAAVDAAGTDRFASLVRRYLDEHAAMQALARGDVKAAEPAVHRALALRTVDLAELRLSFAAQLAGRGAKTQALALLPPNQANYALARDRLTKGKGAGAAGKPLTPSQGYGRLLTRLATDISTDEATRMLGIRLARIGSFANPSGADSRIALAKLLGEAGYSHSAAAEADKIPVNSWFGTLGRAILVDVLARSDDRAGAVSLARSLAAAPGAEAERHVRLGTLLADSKDFSGAAKAFRDAQARYAPDAIPWALLLFEGSALEQGGRWDDARGVLERAASMAPDEPLVLNYLGYAQIERRQNIDAALALLKRASALKPQDASILDSLGWAHFVTGNMKEAVPVLERAAAGAPDDATINEHLGDALWTAGRRFEARYAWNAAAVFAEGEAVARLALKAKEGWKPEYAAR